jgi:hypothetical protein
MSKRKKYRESAACGDWLKNGINISRRCVNGSGITAALAK